MGRFLGVDPLGEKYPSLSPYYFVGNNPIGFIDINGDSITPIGYGQHLQIGVINWDKGISAGEFTLYGGTGVNSAGDEVQMWVASKNYSDGTREELFVLDPESVGEFRRNSSSYSGWSPPEKRVSLIDWYLGGSNGSVWDAYTSTLTPENVAFGVTAIGGAVSLRGISARTAGLGTGRTAVKEWLQGVGEMEAKALIRDIEHAGFKRMSPSSSPVSVFERGGMRIRLDPPQAGTPYNHMHLDYGGNSYDVLLNIVDYRSKEAHIPIR